MAKILKTAKSWKRKRECTQCACLVEFDSSDIIYLNLDFTLPGARCPNCGQGMYLDNVPSDLLPDKKEKNTYRFHVDKENR